MRKIIISIVVIALLAVGGYFLMKQRVAAPVITPVSSDAAGANAAGTAPVTVGEQVAPETLAAEVKEKSATKSKLSAENEATLVKGKFAASFVERFGTYSAEANFSNVRELMPLMSASLRTWAQGIIDANKKPIVGYRIRTTVLAAAAKKSVTDVYTVTTQREETKDETTRRFYQKATVTLVQQEGNWFVDSVVWAEEETL